MKIERPFYKFMRRTALVVFLFFSSVILLGLSGLIIPDESWFNQPVYEPWFGPSFLWHPFLIIVWVLIGIIFIMSLSKIPKVFGPTHKFLTKQEQVQFRSKYPSVPKEALKQSSTLGSTLMMILPMFLIWPLVILFEKVGIKQGPDWYLGLSSLFFEEALPFNYALAIGLAFIPIFWGFIKKMKIAKGDGQKLLDWVNSQDKDTELNVDNEGLSLMRMSYSTKVEGQYKGRSVKTDGTLTGYSKNATYSSIVTMACKSKLKFNLKEKKLKWRKYEGNTVDEIFEKRFELKGCSVAQLPIEFKDWAIHWLRPLNLSVGKNEMIYTLENARMVQFYGFEGLIVLLDEMVQVVKWLEGER